MTRRGAENLYDGMCVWRQEIRPGNEWTRAQKKDHFDSEKVIEQLGNLSVRAEMAIKR